MIRSVEAFQEQQQAAYAELKRVPLLKPSYFEIGMSYEHNMPCCVYSSTDHAILDCSTGVFVPSHRARAEGYCLVKAKTRFQKWLVKTFFKT